jgi:hypothetical protein
MIAYFLCTWVLLSPILILTRKLASPSFFKTFILLLPIFIFLLIAFFHVSFFAEGSVEKNILQFFYLLIISTTYAGWWETCWRYYYKQWPRKFFGEYGVSNIIILISIIPTLIVLLFLLGLIPYLLFDQPTLLALSMILFRGGAEILYDIISFLVCIFDGYC